MQIARFLALAALVLAVPSATLAAEKVAATATGKATPVTVSRAHQIDFTSSVTGRPYRLMVHVPAAPPPPGGFPIMVVIDGNLYFASFVDALRLQGRHFLRPAVILAIGYQTDNIGEQLTIREKDLTLPISANVIARPAYKAVMGDRSKSPDDFGGLDPFLAMIEREAIPRAATLAPVDRADRHLFGHSLGGLAGLRALFNGPANWRTITSSSPSIWWNDRAVLAERPKLPASGPRPSLLLIVGGREDEIPPGLPSAAVPPGVLETMRMAPNVKDLAAELAAGSDVYVSLAVLPDDDHVSIAPLSISRSLRFALGRHQEDWLRAPPSAN
jgi:uncharacterized protein